jgi:hypothetical protein
MIKRDLDPTLTNFLETFYLGFKSVIVRDLHLKIRNETSSFVAILALWDYDDGTVSSRLPL